MHWCLWVNEHGEKLAEKASATDGKLFGGKTGKLAKTMKDRDELQGGMECSDRYFECSEG